MPRVRSRLPQTTLTLLGNSPGAELLERQSAFIRVTGYVPNPAPYFRRARIFVGALRYGAGHKGKIGQAFSYGLPVVMTRIAAEGYPAEHERDCLIADDADAFAEAIVRLHEDPELWEKLSRQGLAALAPFSSSAVSARLHALLQRVSHRDPVKT
jgi:glycosyltransferase involved in cell wall biosynthesis